MPVRESPAKVLFLDYVCDSCKEGVMEFSKSVIKNEQLVYTHVCNKCGNTEDLDIRYPTFKVVKDITEDKEQLTVKMGHFGVKRWYKGDQLHREDGPAVEYPNGTKQYWINGRLHREDGPAVEYADGTQEYWVNGARIK